MNIIHICTHHTRPHRDKKKIHWMGKMRIVREKRKSNEGFGGEWELRTRYNGRSRQHLGVFTCRTELRDKNSGQSEQITDAGHWACSPTTGNRWPLFWFLEPHTLPWPIACTLLRGVNDNAHSVEWCQHSTHGSNLHSYLVIAPISHSSLSWLSIYHRHLFRKLRLFVFSSLACPHETDGDSTCTCQDAVM